MPENNEVTPQQEKSVGTFLREARESRNLSLEQVSRTTRIHAHVLKALEADDTAKLGVVYTKSFLRLYADFLGLNKDEIIARFLAATPEAAVTIIKKVAASAPAPQRLVVRLTAEIGRRLWVQVQRLLRRVPWQRVAVVLLAALLLFGTGRWIGGCRARARERRAVAAVASSTAGKTGASKTAPSRTTAQSAPKPADRKEDGKKAVLVSAASKKETKNVALAVKALGKTWLQVKADGKIIFQGVLAKGSLESWKADEKIELWIGDAGALQLEVNGRFLDRIGRRGQTLKEVLITPKGLVVHR